MGELIDELRKCETISTVDALSYFYQFSLEKCIRQFFRLHINQARGRAKIRTFTRMAMGWSYAPVIAQRTSALILDLLAERLPNINFSKFVWLDNFIFGSAQKDMETILTAFERLASDCLCINQIAKNHFWELLVSALPSSYQNQFGTSRSRHCST
jgi:hypothetical protein